MLIKAPLPIAIGEKQFTVFMAGSIEKGVAETWHMKMEKAFADSNSVVLLNPRREDWDDTWREEKSDPKFYAQVKWELQGLESSDLVVVYFDKEAKSPITLLEFGLYARSGKAVVCCQEGFWKKGNIDIVCEQCNIKQVSTIEELIELVKTKNREYEN